MPETDNDWSVFERKLRTYVAHGVERGAADDVVDDILLQLVFHEMEWSAADNPAA